VARKQKTAAVKLIKSAGLFDENPKGPFTLDDIPAFEKVSPNCLVTFFQAFEVIFFY
jgi:hypothetical protein